MSFKPTGKMIEPKPYAEKHRVCDQCGVVIGEDRKRGKPHFELRWEPELSYNDEGAQTWEADICSVACLLEFAAAGAPRTYRDY